MYGNCMVLMIASSNISSMIATMSSPFASPSPSLDRILAPSAATHKRSAKQTQVSTAARLKGKKDKGLPREARLTWSPAMCERLIDVTSSLNR